MKSCWTSPPGDMTRRAIERILRRAGRRVRNVVVAFCDDQLIVRGTAESYYGWQLAIAACREALSGRHGVQLDCRFEVTRPLGDCRDSRRQQAVA
jgi:hypothetical protein